jgi:lipopolysaccharide/colanic/teichoic acid biosynthesis glycosyltransferase
MKQQWLRYSTALFVGDITIWYISLFAALWVRNLHVPHLEVYFAHSLPFTLIFMVWAAIFVAFGLYDARVLQDKARVPSRLGQALVYSAFAAAALFYVLPLGGFAPKFLLAIIFAIVAPVTFFWRLTGARHFGVRHRAPAVMVGAGIRARELFRTVNTSEAYPIRFAHFCDTARFSSERIVEWVREFTVKGDSKTIVLDLDDPIVADCLPDLFALTYEGVRIVEIDELYEDVYSRIPLELIGYPWLIRHVSGRTHVGYDTLKRLMDLVVATVLFLVTFPIWLVIIVLVRRDGGPAFFIQPRMGKFAKPILVAKFRTMTTMDRGVPLADSKGVITPIGRYLRALRLDELPQLINVIAGDLSLIGPRSEAVGFAEVNRAAIPYFDTRYLITPGLSGWAQIHHEKPPQTVEEAKEKLAYDLYYIKHRSFLLDIKIALKTFYTIVSKKGA